MLWEWVGLSQGHAIPVAPGDKSLHVYYAIYKLFIYIITYIYIYIFMCPPFEVLGSHKSLWGWWTIMEPYRVPHWLEPDILEIYYQPSALMWTQSQYQRDAEGLQGPAF